MAKTPDAVTAWDVTLSEETRQTFTQFLCREIVNAEAAVSVPFPEVRYFWTLYEQGRTRGGQSAPWQDAADLTSYLGTEKTDALHARIMRTIMVDPIWTVEGWGASAAKAPLVEDFHQWQQEQEGLQAFLSRVMLAALIEPRGVLEVYEDTTERKTRKTIQAQLEMTADGTSFKLDADLQPVFAKDEAGNYIEVFGEDGQQGSAEVVIDAIERVRTGPAYRVLSYEHFRVLPGHAREKADIWGYAKRFTKRVDQLREAAEQHIFDKAAVEDLNNSSDVSSALTPSGQNLPVAPQEGDQSEKELWEVQLLTDLDGKGLRWYVATVHVPTQTLLRLKHDDLGQGRFILFVPYPRTDRAHEGYSFVGHKLITTIEEHTAWRNMLADRAELEISAPIKRASGALWDPDDQPMGPRAVIDVRDMNEVQSMQIAQMSAAAYNREQEIVGAAERVAGINDVAAGVTPQQSRTLGETNLVAEQSFVRMDDVIKALLEPMEDLGQIRQAIWVRVLKEREAKGDKGIPVPQTMKLGLESRGGDASTDQMLTADRIEGTFRFKPRGSTENADKSKQRNDYLGFLDSLGILFKVWPQMAQMLGMNKQAAKSALENGLRLFNIPDKQAWIGNAEQFMQPPQPPPGMPVMPWMPPTGVMPPGMPPMGGGVPPMGAGGQ